MQVICECGRIAEVRQRKNGKRLRYKVCKCGCALGGVESALKLEREERENIGTFGDFAAGDVPVKSVVEPAQTEWVPDAETMPDAENDSAPGSKEEKPAGNGLFVLKVLGISVALMGAAVGVKIGIDKFANN